MERSNIWEQASSFLQLCYQELGKSEAELSERLEQVKQELALQGTYEHTLEELQHGAKLAWRNSNRCIGRLFWETLHVFDARMLNNSEQIGEALLHHITWATNGGRIRPAITIFKQQSEAHQGVRIWNHQLIRYAGYEVEGKIVGDPASLAFTRVCERLGWQGKRTDYDLLPLVFSVDGQEPFLLELPLEQVLQVEITHPDLAGFADLGLRWYGVPIVSDMHLEIGGLIYSAAPFNGWYMGTEIGARNLADKERYNKLPEVAAVMGLDTRRASTLWEDRALVELNVAVLESFKCAGVSIVDHHTAAQQFKRFEEKEAVAGREVTGRWSWLIPPLSPATTHVFHSSYRDEELSPRFVSPQLKQ